MSEVCPWCQSELVWDEEIGPEEVCPFCENDLRDYRTVRLSSDEVQEETIAAKKAEEEEQWDEETMALLESLEVDQQTETVDQYDEGIQQLLMEQEEVLLCNSCQSEMIWAGTEEVKAKRFNPRQMADGTPLVALPFRKDIHLCPHCFELKEVMNREDRLKSLQQLARHTDKP
ncbi:hypothetical protein [Marinicrinis sediminis]|uniref:Uncharacterized protein n=1 Tax=Marinicrinis sediminis TaxID=1652465 RepID=A0ABW5R8D9_9BACL